MPDTKDPITYSLEAMEALQILRYLLSTSWYCLLKKIFSPFSRFPVSISKLSKKYLYNRRKLCYFNFLTQGFSLSG